MRVSPCTIVFYFLLLFFPIACAHTAPSPEDEDFPISDTEIVSEGKRFMLMLHITGSLLNCHQMRIIYRVVLFLFSLSLCLSLSLSFELYMRSIRLLFKSEMILIFFCIVFAMFFALVLAENSLISMFLLIDIEMKFGIESDDKT